jgi:hypothetical protein
MIERMLVAARFGNCGLEDVLPLACSHDYYGDKCPIAESGIALLWSSYEGKWEFLNDGLGFGCSDLKSVGSGCLFVYEVEYEEAQDEWAHLRGGTWRRANLSELGSMSGGGIPWGGRWL